MIILIDNIHLAKAVRKSIFTTDFDARVHTLTLSGLDNPDLLIGGMVPIGYVHPWL